jgi:hypothetical protein
MERKMIVCMNTFTNASREENEFLEKFYDECLQVTKRIKEN